MTRRRRVLMAAALLGMAAAAAWAKDGSDGKTGSSDAVANSSSPVSADEVQRLLLLAPGRPLRIDLLIFVDGQPLLQTWRARFDRVFAEEDRDKSGGLDVARASRVCEAMSGEFGLKQSRAKINEALQGLAGKDKRIERQPLLDYVQRTFPPFAVTPAPPGGTVAAAALFGLLDQNHDGRLTRAELEQAATQLLGRDFDDDQLIGERELIIDPTQQVDRGDTKSSAIEAAMETVIVLAPGFDAAVVAAAVLKHYDHDHDGRLAVRGAMSELVLSPEVVAQFDTNGDGALDAQELEALVRQPADLVLPLEFGAAGPRRVAPPALPRPSAELRVRRKIDGGYKLYLGDAQLDINRNNRNPTQNGPNLRFSAFDTDNNGYLDAMEVSRSPLLSAAFPSMDADGDGKVTPGEFQTYVNTQSAAAAARIRLQVIDRGQDLFSLLDTNGDGLLTPRELLAAPALIDTHDRNGDGALSGFEIPQRWTLDLARESLPIPDNRVARPRIRNNQLTGSDAGPLWFRKMDRNHDGDISPSEWLGSAADFAAADANHDGLIDAEEAEAFSKRRGEK